MPRAAREIVRRPHVAVIPGQRGATRRTLERRAHLWANPQGEIMEQQALLDRITANPEIFGGKPIIRGMRISVELVLSLLAQGESEEDVLADYPDLERDDIRACLAYARAAIANDTLQAVRVSGQ